jgi:hypothetical protein
LTATTGSSLISVTVVFAEGSSLLSNSSVLLSSSTIEGDA